MQVVLSILSRAGGVGKTTIASNVFYELGAAGIATCLIDLDPNFSLASFIGLAPVEQSESVAQMFDPSFDGDYPFQDAWDTSKCAFIQGHESMGVISDNLKSRRRSEYVIADRFRKYPLPHEVIILDCPGTQSAMTTAALAASTHILLPVQLEVKIATTPSLITWCFKTSEELFLEPPPQILGIVPNNYDKSGTVHRQCIEQLPSIADGLGVRLFEAIPTSKEIINAAMTGLPLKKHRPGHPANKRFKQIADAVKELVNG
ncbi:MAG: ParA family protein [Cyanobacteria bacterium J06626_18]